jgi:hypothetical protein
MHTHVRPLLSSQLCKYVLTTSVLLFHMFPKRVLGHVKRILSFLPHELLGTYNISWIYFLNRVLGHVKYTEDYLVCGAKSTHVTLCP